MSVGPLRIVFLNSTVLVPVEIIECASTGVVLPVHRRRVRDVLASHGNSESHLRHKELRGPVFLIGIIQKH